MANFFATFWANHKVKILAMLGGLFTTLATIGATLGCHKLPPPFSAICTTVATSAIQEMVVPPIQGPVVLPGTVAPPLFDLCPGAPGGDYCTSIGYALPLPDGGRCRCL